MLHLLGKCHRGHRDYRGARKEQRFKDVLKIVA
jgi:hypothetical protein